MGRPSSTMGYPGAPAGPYLAACHPSRLAQSHLKLDSGTEKSGCKTENLKDAANRRIFVPKLKKAMHCWVAQGRQSRVVRYPEAL